MAGLGEGQSGWSEDSLPELAKEAAGGWLSPAVREGLTGCIYIWCRHRVSGGSTPITLSRRTQSKRKANSGFGGSLHPFPS